MICIVSFLTSMSYDLSLIKALLKRRVMTNDMWEEPFLTRRKSTDQNKDNNKNKAPMALATLPTRSLVIGLEAARAPVETTAQRGASSSVPIYRPNWSIRWEDLCSDPSIARELGRGFIAS